MTRSQLLAAGVSERTIYVWLENGRLESLHAGVYVIAGSPSTWEQRMFGAVMAGGDGAVASHRSSARLWELGDFDEIELTLPYPGDVVVAGAVVHRSTFLVRETVRFRRGIPVCSPLTTLIELGAVLGPESVEECLDRGLVARLYSVAAVEWAITDGCRSGRTGCGRLRKILDQRALGDVAPDSLLEPRFARIVRAAELPDMTFQHEVTVSGVRFRLDAAYPHLMIAIEIDGWSSRSTPAALERANWRQNLLTLAGWRVIRFTWDDIVRRPKYVAAQLRELLCALAAL